MPSNFRIPHRVKNRWRSIVPLLRANDFIHITADGFWKPRSNQRWSFNRAAREFNRIDGKTIVEVGSGLHGPMSGNSIYVWAKKTKATKIFAIDLDPRRIAEVATLVPRYHQIVAIEADGNISLKNWESQIDMLYLDYWVPDIDGAPLIGQARADAYLETYSAAKAKLAQTSLILIDDTDHVDPWKQTLIIPEARRDGFQVMYIGRQTLLKRG